MDQIKDSPVPRHNYLAYGTGLEVSIELSRRDDFDLILQEVQAIEIIPESFFYGKAAGFIKQLGKSGNPVIGHCIDLSVGTDRPLTQTQLDRIKEVLDRVNCTIFSDHICMTKAGGTDIGQLTTLPFTQQVVDIICSKVELIYKQFKMPFMLENITNRFLFPKNELSEPEFINSITRKSGCGLLLDVTNLHINSINYGFDPYRWFDEIDAASVMGIHMAGGETDGKKHYDTHSRPVPKAAWQLLSYVLERASPQVIIVEWDMDMPSTERLIEETERAKEVARKVFPDLVASTKRNEDHAHLGVSL